MNAKQSSVLRQFMGNMVALHQTAVKGSSHISFVDDEHKQLLKQFSVKLQKTKQRDPNLLKLISDVALDKARELWEHTYHTLITEPLINYLCLPYKRSIKSYKDFPTTFPLTKIPPPLDPDHRAKILEEALSPSKRDLQRQRREIVAEAKAAHSRSSAVNCRVLKPDFDDIDYPLATMKWVQPVVYDGHMEALAHKVWLSVRKSKAFAWMARWVVDPATNKKYMQPGILHGYKKTFRLGWLPCEAKHINKLKKLN